MLAVGFHASTQPTGSTLLGPPNNHYGEGMSRDRYYASLWNVGNGSLYSALPEHSQKVNGVSFSPDGQLFSSSSDDDSVAILRVSDGSLVRKIEAGMGGITDVDFSPNSLLLATGSWDGVIGLWQVSNGHMLRSLAGHEKSVRDVEFSPDG